MTEQAAQEQQVEQSSESSTNTGAQQGGEGQLNTGAGTGAENQDNPLLSSVSQDYAELVKAKGWKTADDVISSYSNMEKFAGKFSSRGVVIPDSDDAEEWGKVYQKLGRPEAPNGYEFNHIDTKQLDDKGKEIIDFVRDTGFKHGLSKKQLEGFVSEYDAKMEALETAQVEEMQRNVDKQVGELKTKWGSAWDKNVALARAAGKKFGIEGDKLNALENTAGFAPMMEVLAEIGSYLGEDGFVQGSGGDATQVRTPKQALTELKEVQADPDYLDSKKNPNRHKVLREKARDLYAMAYPSAKE
jgi:hypothetical protein